jgi:hypothetical protein
MERSQKQGTKPRLFLDILDVSRGRAILQLSDEIVKVFFRFGNVTTVGFDICFTFADDVQEVLQIQ